ncbi:hypothetical protein JMJ35_010075 [Cladonia borealis]|uniref:Ribokinase-like protein n=1 Tax=Cladonia borealis TaxID=184061 RepID=A0AA39UXN6_9LECA|nr:hypothetical protein JMJ35_010075 [Cladonia borealis]
MDFVSMGMIIIDAIYPETGPPLHDILGGAGTYATVGARLFCHGDASIRIGFVIHAGNELSQKLRDEIASWKTGTHIIETPNRKTTRGKNVYVDGIRHFEFCTPKIQVEPSMLPEIYLTARTYHLICTPSRCIELVKELLAKREKLVASISGLSEKPIFVWEPMEHSCRPSERMSFYEALKYVDVFSPNHDEMQALFADLPNANHNDLGQGGPVIDPHTFEVSAFGLYLRLKANGFGDKTCALVLRQGEKGCTVCSANRQFRVPAYHRALTNLWLEEQDQWVNKVIDVTGGGNAFLGGFCIGLGMTSRWREEDPSLDLSDFEGAAFYGTVAASFAIEQIGTPKVIYRNSDGAELWNGDLPSDRISAMLSRVHKQAATQPVSLAFDPETIGALIEICRTETSVSSKALLNNKQPSENDAEELNKRLARSLRQTTAIEENIKLPDKLPQSLLKDGR